jgi:hypothetical protein
LRTFRTTFREDADSRTSAAVEAGAMNADTAIFILLETYGVLTPLVLLAVILRLAAPGPHADEPRDSRA